MNIVLACLLSFFFGSGFGFVVCFLIMDNLGGEE